MLISFIEKVKLVYYKQPAEGGSDLKVTAKEAAGSRSWLEMKLIRGNRGAADFKSKFFCLLFSEKEIQQLCVTSGSPRSAALSLENQIRCFAFLMRCRCFQQRVTPRNRHKTHLPPLPHTWTWWIPMFDSRDQAYMHRREDRRQHDDDRLVWLRGGVTGTRGPGSPLQ